MCICLADVKELCMDIHLTGIMTVGLQIQKQWHCGFSFNLCTHDAIVTMGLFISVTFSTAASRT